MTRRYQLAYRFARRLMVGGELVDAAAREAAEQYPPVDADTLAADLMEEEHRAAAENHLALLGRADDDGLRGDLDGYHGRAA